MRHAKVILNPVAGRGYAARVEADLRGYLDREGLDYDISHTQGVWHAAEMAEQASRDGYDTVVAAGGDGTFNEVANGLLAAAGGPAMGVLPVGTGSDFANTVGIDPDLAKACHQLASGRVRMIDVGLANLPGSPPRHFVNALGIGFEGVLTIEARKFKHLRGMALYLPAVLKTVFVSFDVPRVTITLDQDELALPAIMVCIANGPREGGGFFIAPQAEPDDGLFDICIVDKISKLNILSLLPHFMKGTHVQKPPVHMMRTKRISVKSADGLAAHMDGELICTEGHSISCEILPHRLPVLC